MAVAIVDVGADSIGYREDPYVRFVDLTPKSPEGRFPARASVGSLDHGQAVARTFVDEYRRLDPEARITFYTVNPFLSEGIGGGSVLSRQMLRAALPKMRDAGVRVVMTTFGTDSEQAGRSLLREFRANGMIVFAAAPNDPADRAIWPAASKDCISVADGSHKGMAVYRNRSWSGWVDFVAGGDFKAGGSHAQGSSFAVPRVAAYGAHISRGDPEATVESVRERIRAVADAEPFRGGTLARVGRSEMRVRFLSSSEGTMLARVVPSGHGRHQDEGETLGGSAVGPARSRGMVRTAGPSGGSAAYLEALRHSGPER